MPGLPNTRFYLDDGTGTYPEDVTAYVRLVDGYQFTRGRADTRARRPQGRSPWAFNNGRSGRR